MITLRVCLIVVVVLYSHEVSSLLENLIEDGSFEEYKSNTWNMTERTSTGATHPSSSPRRDCLTRHSGRCSVVFGPFKHVEALFMSQAPSTSRTDLARPLPVRSVWNSGRTGAVLHSCCLLYTSDAADE